MKVLIIDGLVGNEYTELLCDGLYKSQVDVRLIIPKNRPVQVHHDFKILKWSPSKDAKVNKSQKIKDYFVYIWKLFNYIYTEQIDLVHYQFFRNKSELLIFLLLRLLGKNILITAHNVLPHQYHWSNFYYQRILFLSASAVIAHSMYIKRRIIKRFNIPDKRIYVIPHGSFNQFLDYNNINNQQARKKLGIKYENNVILFFGYIKPYKGLDLLLDAFEIIAKKSKRFYLIIAGNAESKKLKEFYLRKISAMSSNKQIIPVLEYIPAHDVAIYFMAADIVALPYQHIYHSGVIHTAYSFSKPVIATDVGDFREVTENGACGFISKEINAGSYAECMVKSFNDKNKLIAMGKFCHQLSQTKYNWNSIALKTKNLYFNIIYNHEIRK